MDYPCLLRRSPSVIPSMNRSAVAEDLASRRSACMAALLATLATAGAFAPRRRRCSDDVTVEPRIVEARLDASRWSRSTCRCAVALRASQAATIRSIAFTDAFVGQVPVWIERVDGDWPLEPGRELVIPAPMQVRIHARDAIGVDDLAAIVRTGAVTVRASVEAAIETPWLARLMFMGPTRTLVRYVVLELPIRPARRLRTAGAHRRRPRRRGPARRRDVAGHRPQSPARLQRDGPARRRGVAAVTTRYGVEGAAGRRRERRVVGLWWSLAASAPTREAIEPWRFDVADADGAAAGRRACAAIGAVHIAATADRPALGHRSRVLDEVLLAPEPAQALRAGRRPDLLPAARRPATRVEPGAPAASWTPLGGAATVAGRCVSCDGHRRRRRCGVLAGAVAGVVWTSVASAGDDLLRIATLLHRLSFGSRW